MRSFVEGLVALWRARNAEVYGRARWVGGLTARGARLLALRSDPPGLQRFREQVLVDRRAFEERVSRRVDDRLQALGEPGRRWLALLETEPDLLGPLGTLRAEAAHARALAWARGGASHRPGGLGREPLRAFLILLRERGCGFAEDALERDLTDVTVTTGLPVPRLGRAELRLGFPDLGELVVALEIDPVEQEQPAVRGRGAMVSLTVSGEASADDGAIPVRFEELLRAWLPVAGAGESGEHDYLRRYLKSVAVGLCGLSGEGPCEAWHWTRRARTLDFIGEGR
jgi:hypothetical protein